MKGSREFPQLALRLPPELKEWLAKEAAANGRSLNSETVVRLEESRGRGESQHQCDPALSLDALDSQGAKVIPAYALNAPRISTGLPTGGSTIPLQND